MLLEFFNGLHFMFYGAIFTYDHGSDGDTLLLSMTLPVIDGKIEPSQVDWLVERIIMVHGSMIHVLLEFLTQRPTIRMNTDGEVVSIQVHNSPEEFLEMIRNEAYGTA